MRGTGVDVAPVSKPLLRLFTGYLEWYLKRNVHALRLARTGFPGIGEETPLIVCLNHPSWWDPLVALTLATRVFPDRTHYGPIEAGALTKYRFFEKLGFFGIEPGTAAGAARFLRVGQVILRQPGTALWITAQGTFVDARVRPVSLRPGVGHLVRRIRGAAVLPLAVEYPFWEERYPEALARFGVPIFVEDGRSHAAAEWTATIAGALGETQDALARQSVNRERRAFDTVIGGKSGVGGVYDVWRAARAALLGRRFEREHHPEHP